MASLQPGITPGIIHHSGLLTINGSAPPPAMSVAGGDGSLSGPPTGDYGCEQNLNMDLANNKEKTPMCLINELARFNKVCLVCYFIY